MKARYVSRWSSLAVIAIVTPLAVNVPGTDGTYGTTVTLAGGGGTHVSGLDVYMGTTQNQGFDCASGESYDSPREVRQPVDLEQSFKDFGGAVDQRLGDSKLHIGVRGGYVWESATVIGGAPVNPLTNQSVSDFSETVATYRNSSYWYVNPYFSVEARKVGFGLGIVRSELPLRTQKKTRVPEDVGKGRDTQPSFHLRLGPRDKAYVSYSLWEGIPIYSGGGMHNTGIGFRMGRHIDFWAGYAFGGPYQSNGALLQATLGATSPVAVDVSFRVPTDYRGAGGLNTISELGGSVGLRFRR